MADGLDWWRDFFRGGGAGICDVIENAILVAAADAPRELLHRRDRIAERLFTALRRDAAAAPPPSLGSVAASATPATPVEEDKGSVRRVAEKECKVDSSSNGAHDHDVDDDSDSDDERLRRAAASNYGHNYDEDDEEEDEQVADEEQEEEEDHEIEELEALTNEIDEESQIVGEVLRIKDLLLHKEDHSDATLFESLRRLQLMQLSVTTLKATEIGRAVNRLRKHNSQQIRHLVRTLIEGWKVLVDEWVNTTNAALADNSPDSSNPSVVDEEEEGLPSPPLDEGAFFATQTTSVQLSEFFDEMDEDGNLRHNNDANVGNKRGNTGGRPANNSAVARQEPPRPAPATAEKVQFRRPELARQDPSIRQANPQRPQSSSLQIKPHGVLNKQSKPSSFESGPGRPIKAAPQLKPTGDMKLKQTREQSVVERKPMASQMDKSRLAAQPSAGARLELAKPKTNDDGLDNNRKLEAAKRRLQERYQEAENAKRQRTIQVMELGDIPKPKHQNRHPVPVNSATGTGHDSPPPRRARSERHLRAPPHRGKVRAHSSPERYANPLSPNWMKATMAQRSRRRLPGAARRRSSCRNLIVSLFISREVPGAMSQRSPGERGDGHGEHHTATKIPPKSAPNPINNHPNQFASSSTHQIYKRVERFCLDKSSRGERSLPAEAVGDGATDSSMAPSLSPASTNAEPLPLHGGASPPSRSALSAPAATTHPPAPPAPASPLTSRLLCGKAMSSGVERFRMKEESSRYGRLLTTGEIRDGAAPLLPSCATPLPLRSASAPTATCLPAPPSAASPLLRPKLPHSNKTCRMEQAELLSGGRYWGAPSASIAADPMVGLAQQADCCSRKVRPGKSYAEVVREGAPTSHQYVAVKTEMMCSSPATHHQQKVLLHNQTSISHSDGEAKHKWLQSANADRHRNTCVVPRKSYRRRHVMFVNNPKVVFFHKDSAPASIRLLCSLQSQCELRSCFKQPKVPVTESVACDVPWKIEINPLSAETSHLCVLDFAQAPANKIQTDSTQVSWQPVRDRYWWRRRKEKNIYSPPATGHYNSVKFKEKVGDRCFNCLARGHKVAQCRDPPKCWRCRNSGHISSCCTSKASSKRPRLPNADDPHGDRRRTRIIGTIHRTPRWSNDEAKGINHSPKLDYGSSEYSQESSRKKQIRQNRCRSPTLLRFNDSRGERRASQPHWWSKEKSTSWSCYSTEIMEVPTSHSYVAGTDVGLGQFQHHTGIGTRAKSDAIIIVPQEHSPTTQQLEAWLGSLSRAGRVTQSMSDNISVVSPGAHSPNVTSPSCRVMSRKPTHVPAETRSSTQLWRFREANNHGSKIKAINDTVARITNSGEQLPMESVVAWQYMFPLNEDKATSRDSDAIHIIPTLSFPDEQLKISTNAISGNKHAESMDLSLATIPFVLEISADNSPSTLSGTSVSEPCLESEQMTEDIPLEEHTEIAPTVEQTPLTPHTEIETDSNFTNMLKHFGEPSLAQTPIVKPIAKDEQKKEQRRSPRLRIKQKKPKQNKLTVKMVHEVLARWGFTGEIQKPNDIMLQKYPGRYNKSLAGPTMETRKKRRTEVPIKKKERKKADSAILGGKRSSSTH